MLVIAQKPRELSLPHISDGSLLGLLFKSEGVGDTFFRNVGLSPNYRAI
jgi:hypothetical protein